MTVAYGGRENSAEEVQVLLAIDIPYSDAFTFVQDQRFVIERPDGREQELPLALEDALAIRHLVCGSANVHTSTSMGYYSFSRIKLPPPRSSCQ
jgi:hypothetical protein